VSEELDIAEVGELEESTLIGTTLADRYQILSLLGEGGMGLVYKARHVLMRRMVAIKIIRQEYVSSLNAQQRFQQEAQAVSALKHPNIVDVYDFGISPDGTPYLVMDYLEGTSLTELIRDNGKMDPQRAMGIFRQACRALNHAHQNGIIHRDFKASNIMICSGDDGEVVKIVDFGMAKLLRGDASGASQMELTQQGDVFGSPLYMSPEQCKGQKLDERSDIYSLGCVMYLVLTGAPPLIGDNVLDTMQRQINEEPIPISHAVGEDDFPAFLDNIVSKALCKNPNDRYQSIALLLAELEDGMSGGAGVPLLIDEIPPEKAQKPFEKYTKLIQGKTVEIHLGLTAVLIALCVGLACFVSGRMFEIANDDKEVNLWVDYQQAGERDRLQGNLDAAEKNYRMAIAEANKFGRRDPRLAKSLLSLGTTYVQNKEFSKAENILNRAVTVLSACYGKDCQELSGPYLVLGKALAAEGKFEKAEEFQKKALELVESNFGSDSDRVAGILTDYAKMKRQNGDSAGAKDIEERLSTMSKQHKRS
jgi:tRNA A-37 threonylcarbamoyl transferase component Bud32